MLYTVIVDIQLTRRKRLSSIVKPDGEVVYSSSKFSEIFEWLAENNVSAFNVQTETDVTFHIRFYPGKSIMADYIKALAVSTD